MTSIRDREQKEKITHVATDLLKLMLSDKSPVSENDGKNMAKIAIEMAKTLHE